MRKTSYIIRLPRPKYDYLSSGFFIESIKYYFWHVYKISFPIPYMASLSLNEKLNMPKAKQRKKDIIYKIISFFHRMTARYLSSLIHTFG